MSDKQSRLSGSHLRMFLLGLLIVPVGGLQLASGQAGTGLVIEVEAGPVWQSRNDVQIPNSDAGTRFSLVDVAGSGPAPVGRLYLTWNVNSRHSVRALLAPLSLTGKGSAGSSIDFAGASYDAVDPIEATYQFNSWRLGYRYRYLDKDRLKLTVGFTAKLRDAKIELSQGSVTSKDTDLGFVPLLHLGADWQFANRFSLVTDVQGLAGGPGRAFDVAVKARYAASPKFHLGAGYRTVEGGADVDAVYNFAWLHYAVVSVTYQI